MFAADIDRRFSHFLKQSRALLVTTMLSFKAIFQKSICGAIVMLLLSISEHQIDDHFPTPDS